MDFATIKAAVEARRQHPKVLYKAEASDMASTSASLPLPAPGAPNGRWVDKYIEEHNAIIRNKFEKGRYLGFLMRHQVPDVLDSKFHSSPVSLKPKWTPGKFRAIHDFARGQQSINMQIDPSKFSSTWTTFDVVSRIIATPLPAFY